MPSACVHAPGAKVSLESERLVIVVPPAGDGETGETRREIPLRDLERMVMGERVSVTTPALAEMLRRGIPVCLMDGHGNFLGSFQPAAPDHGAARLSQYQRALDAEFALRTAGRIVVSKIYNQRRILQRIVAGRRSNSIDSGPVPAGFDAALNLMDAMMQKAGMCRHLDELRGCEGAASAHYFALWAQLLPDEFPFERRSTRPPLNPVNACISFTATMLYHEMVSFLHARGLDPALGFLHTTENGRWSLALDLIEPFRPVVVEALTLDLFSRRILNHKHFEPAHGGIYLNRDGRAKLILQYEKRMDRQFLSEAVEHRTSLRTQLDHQALLLKSSLDDPERFEPFLVN